MTRRPIEPLRARAAEQLRDLLSSASARNLADVIGDPLLSCLLIVTRARIADLLRDEAKDFSVRSAAARILRALDAAARAT